MINTYFDHLPIELFYEIFSYLRCEEIFRSFGSINDYINNILLSYDNYLLDLSSSMIGKHEFDLICLLLNRKQIIGLKIGNNRFNIINRFLSDVCRDQSLIRLRSLWICETTYYNLSFIKQINRIIDYNQLVSFRFDKININLYDEIPENCSFKSLSHLVGCSSKQFRQLTKQIPTHLTFLHMFFDSIEDLNSFLLFNAHQLKSIGIGIQCNLNNINQFSSLFKNYQWTQLIQFNLNLQEIDNVLFNTLENILSSMCRLKYLTLILNKPVSINSGILNGYQWRSFITRSIINLIKFHFYFPIEELSDESISSILVSFRCRWWLKEKRWFVEYMSESNALFTVPYFSPETFYYSNTIPFNRLHNEKLINSNIKNFLVDIDYKHDYSERSFPQYKDGSQFCNVKQISFNGYLTTDIYNRIKTNINIKTLEYLQLSSSSLDTTQIFAHIISDLNNITSINIQYKNILDIFRLILSPIITVRRVSLSGYNIKSLKELFSHLYRIFPRLISFSTNYHSRSILSLLLNNLNYLEELKLNLNSNQYVPNDHWIEKHTRLFKNSFQTELFNYDKQRIFIIWINQYKCIQNHSHHNLLSCFIQ